MTDVKSSKGQEERKANFTTKAEAGRKTTQTRRQGHQLVKIDAHHEINTDTLIAAPSH
jgi:hypothetical protein